MGEQTVVPLRQEALQPIARTDDTDPLPHVGDHRAAGRKNAVRYTTAHVRIIRGRNHARTSTLADAEKPDAMGIGIGTALQMSQGRLNILDLVMGDPLAWFVAGLRFAVSLPPEL